MGSIVDRFAAWWREELRLLTADTWADGVYAGPAPCTLADPRCQATLARLAEVAERMKRMKARVLDGRTVTSAAATDVRDVLLAVLLWHAGIVAVAWWAGERTAVNRMRAAAECPGPEIVARREIDYASGKVRCVYYWRKK